MLKRIHPCPDRAQPAAGVGNMPGPLLGRAGPRRAASGQSVDLLGLAAGARHIAQPFMIASGSSSPPFASPSSLESLNKLSLASTLVFLLVGAAVPCEPVCVAETVASVRFFLDFDLPSGSGTHCRYTRKRFTNRKFADSYWSPKGLGFWRLGFRSGVVLPELLPFRPPLRHPLPPALPRGVVG